MLWWNEVIAGLGAERDRFVGSLRRDDLIDDSTDEKAPSW
jgi:hypothetical protein